MGNLIIYDGWLGTCLKNSGKVPVSIDKVASPFMSIFTGLPGFDPV